MAKIVKGSFAFDNDTMSAYIPKGKITFAEDAGFRHDSRGGYREIKLWYVEDYIPGGPLPGSRPAELRCDGEEWPDNWEVVTSIVMYDGTVRYLVAAVDHG